MRPHAPGHAPPPTTQHPYTHPPCRVGADNMCIVHVSLVPIIGVVGEQKTKPTQHSVATLRSLGLHPNMLACRCSEPLDEGVRQKLVGGGGWGRGMGGGRCSGGRVGRGAWACHRAQGGGRGGGRGEWAWERAMRPR